MNAFIKKNFAWFIIVFLTVVVWLQIFASWSKDDRIERLEDGIDRVIDENVQLRNDLHETTVRAAKLAEDLEKVGKKGSK